MKLLRLEISRMVKQYASIYVRVSESILENDKKINKLLDENINEIVHYASGLDVEWNPYLDDFDFDIDEYYVEEVENETALCLRELKNEI